MLSNVRYALLLSYIFLKSANISCFGAGALISVLVAMTVDLSLYSYTTLMSSTTAIIVDGVAGIVMGGIAGGIIGAVLGMGGSSETAEQ